jgi:hypothetical protein
VGEEARHEPEISNEKLFFELLERKGLSAIF